MAAPIQVDAPARNESINGCVNCDITMDDDESSIAWVKISACEYSCVFDVTAVTVVDVEVMIGNKMSFMREAVDSNCDG